MDPIKLFEDWEQRVRALLHEHAEHCNVIASALKDAGSFLPKPLTFDLPKLHRENGRWVATTGVQKFEHESVGAMVNGLRPEMEGRIADLKAAVGIVKAVRDAVEPKK